MIAAVLAGCCITGAMYFAARNHDDQLPISVTGKKKN